MSPDHDDSRINEAREEVLAVLDERLSWRGREVAWTVLGSGPAVVFCHGTPWSSALWVPFAQALSKSFRVFLWDMPGYGASSKLADHAVDLGVQGELMSDLLDLWRIDAPPHVVAHDYGGAVSLRAHLLHGCDFPSLTLVDVVAIRPWGSPFFTLVRRNTDVFAALPATIHTGVLEAYIQGASSRGLRPDDLAMLMTPWLGERGQAAFYRQIAAADERFTDDIEARLAEVRCPTHILWGTEDTWIPPECGTQLHALIPHSTLQLVEGAGHLVPLDTPVALADKLRGWLDERNNGSRSTVSPRQPTDTK